MELSWQIFKEFVDDKTLKVQYAENSELYAIWASDTTLTITCRVIKDGGADLTDFETNYKPTANTGYTSLSTTVTSSALPTGASTSTLQTTGNSSLSSIDGKTPTLVSGRQPVDGSGVTQPISAASLPLPTGASTETTLSALNVKFNSLGQKTMANSAPVTLSSDQTSLGIKASGGTLTDRSGTATNSSALLMASNSSRRYLYIRNTSAGNIWINFTTTPAVAASPSILLQPTDPPFIMDGTFVSTEAIYIVSASGSRTFTAKEG